MRHLSISGLIVVLGTASATLQAQRLGPGDRRPPQDRAALEQRFKQRLTAVVQRQLGLTDEETRRLSEINQKYETKRMELVRRERNARVALRHELMENTTPSEEQVSQLLDELKRIPHERLDLVDAEQADLSKFLSPSQRARYLGLQEQVRRRIEEVRDRPAFMNDSAGPPGRGLGVPGRRSRRPPPG